MYFQSWRMNLRLVAGVCGALVAIGGFAGALASYTDYLPATRGFAKETAKSETESSLVSVNAQMLLQRRESDETRLQVNKLRIEGLRANKWTLSEKAKGVKDAGTRQLLQAQMDQVDDDIRDANAERDRLKIISP